MAGDSPMNVYNNMIVNNVSTHEGGGIGLNDAPNVRVYNNTIMKNMTTATAVTSERPAGACGTVDVRQQRPAAGDAARCGRPDCFSDPLLFNNIFWDNRAGTRSGGDGDRNGSAGRLEPDQPVGPRGGAGAGVSCRRPTP